MFRRLHDPSPSLTVTVDGASVSATPGETVAAVLLRTPPFHARKTLLSGAPRAPYCMMGVCFDCLATIDGQHGIQTCLTIVHDGMCIERRAEMGPPA